MWLREDIGTCDISDRVFLFFWKEEIRIHLILQKEKERERERGEAWLCSNMPTPLDNYNRSFLPNKEWKKIVQQFVSPNIFSLNTLLVVDHVEIWRYGSMIFD